MWESLANILTSTNAVAVLTFLAVCIIGGVVLVKTNLLQIHTNSVRLGAADTERNIIRQQQDYVRLHLKSVENDLAKPDGYNEWLGRFVVMRVYAEYVEWISFNHLSKSEAYIKVKQNKLMDLINQYTYREEFKTDEFEEFIRNDTKQTILELIQIREVYKDQFK